MPSCVGFDEVQKVFI